MRLAKSLPATVPALLLLGLGLAACSGNTQDSPPSSTASVATGGVDQAAGIQWRAPEGWQRQAARPMRAATYTIPAA